MAYQSVIVVDDFYEDPDQVRNLALGLKFNRKEGATYPGKEAVAPGVDWSAARQRLRDYIQDDCDGMCPKPQPFHQGKFRLALATDEKTRIDKVHVDVQRWSGIVYLTKPEHCVSGVVLYRHRPTNSVFWSEDWFRENYAHLFYLPEDAFKAEALRYFRDPANFEQIGLIPLAYNRAILLMAHALHGTGESFGDCAETGRLTQHFEFYETT